MNKESSAPEEEQCAGMAALSICEALLLALKDQRILPQNEFAGILQDAAAAHENAPGSEAEKNTHRQVAALINRINLGEKSGLKP
ncbi:hypothetical protein [Loktanella sp. M215]|uniref:hypothetical protein n=1 Tax=Loktanella sp. M215 TaxID=2675431 RepID=UPI001F193950|nr:hypothetical protein [Loktanella sp. M215]MCF7701864.1 hypothetical protein [Loktanella sp. M215]